MGYLYPIRIHAVALLLVFVVVSACSGGSEPGPQTPATPTPTRPPATPTPGFVVEAPSSSGEAQPTLAPTPVFVEDAQPSATSHECLVNEALLTAAPSALVYDRSGETAIVIDGDASDWNDRPVVARDALGDAEHRFDIGAIQAFVNEDAFYFLANGGGDLTVPSVELEIVSEERRYRYLWESSPWSNAPWSADVTDEWVDRGTAKMSAFAVGEAFEARIDRRDLPSDSFEIVMIKVWEGHCCDWETSDDWEGRATPTQSNERDPELLTARNGSAEKAIFTLGHPDIRAIDLTYHPESGTASITAGPGAVPQGSTVIVAALERADWELVEADANGAFSASVTASPGTHVMIKQDLGRHFLRPDNQGLEEDLIPPGILLRIPDASSADGYSFKRAGRFCCDAEDEITWGIEGTLDKIDALPGDEIVLRGQAVVYAGPLRQPPRFEMGIKAELLTDEGGRQVGRAGKLITPFLTATGLPIERELEGDAEATITLAWEETPLRWEGSRWVGDFETTLRLSERMREGHYSLIVESPWSISNADLEPSITRPFDLVSREKATMRANLATLGIGDPQTPRLATLLLADEVSEGSRGGYLAREDEGLFDISSRAATRHQPVLPRLDPYGTAWTYQLEPFVPMVDTVDRALPNPPAINFDFSRSTLTVKVQRPDGETDTLGPAPMTRYGVKSPRTLWNGALGLGGGELREIPQLLGDPGVFAYEFPTDGDYAVSLEGQIADLDGRHYAICGTYDATVGNVLDIEMGFLPTTPFEVGDTIAPVVTTIPGVPAVVTYTITHVGPDGAKTVQTFEGTASANGYWDGDGRSLTFTNHGEYRIDVDARYVDEQGRLWAGRMRSGSVVMTPNAPLVAHGRRGPDNQNEISPPWAFETAFVMNESDHMQFPYFTGDVLWGMEHTDAGDAVVTHASVQILDQNDSLLQRVERQVLEGRPEWSTPRTRDLIRAGQMPLLLGPEPITDDIKGAHPDDIDLWTYMYSSAQRPGVRVREIIQGSDINGAYWRFGDSYQGQSGNGPEGDLPDDYKFMYIAAVVRDDNLYEGYYAGYGSAWVHTRDNDDLGARFFPPFQGAAGGPDGGPLFRVHDYDVDMFFLPLGVRPGNVLVKGDLFRMSGPVMPTLPSLVEYVVTAPDGTQHALGGYANAVGYFYDPADDFVLDQTGVWSVEVTLTHDGMTSAGPVQEPYPTGGVLSPDGRTFTFTVVEDDAAEIDITTTLAERHYD